MVALVEVLGPGCRRCSDLLELVRQVARAECPHVEARYQRLAPGPTRLPGGHPVKVIEVLGSGCNNCQRVEANAREAVAQLGIEAEIRHITDYAEIAQRGVMNTPGLVIDGTVVSTGKIPASATIAA